jgi:endonuclease YncB( thermonuclease family)
MVTDGDSIVFAQVGRVRLLGIDAPELSQKPFGKQSQGALALMIPVGTTVQLEQDVQRRTGAPAHMQWPRTGGW